MKNRLAWTKFVDNGGRRSGVDRRQYSYTTHVPERRSGKDRRNRKDRRSEYGRRNIMQQIFGQLTAEERMEQ
jgi:hypothetical protein